MSSLPLPRVVDLVGLVLNRWIDAPVPRLMASLTAGVLFTLAVLAGVFGYYLVLFLGVLPGIILDDGLMITLGVVGSFAAYTVVFVLLFACVQTTLTSGIVASVARSQNGGAELSLMSSLSELSPRLLGYLAHASVVALVSTFLAVFLIVPGLLFGASVILSLSGMVMYGWSTRESLERCVRFALQEPLWHLGLYTVIFIGAVVLSNVPLIGWGLGVIFTAEVCVEACTAAFGRPVRPDLLVTAAEGDGLRELPGEGPPA